MPPGKYHPSRSIPERHYGSIVEMVEGNKPSEIASSMTANITHWSASISTLVASYVRPKPFLLMQVICLLLP